MKITRYRLFAIVALFALCVLAPVPAAAQSIATPYMGFTQSGLGGGPAAGGFPLSGLDHVDLMSGAMRLRIPLLQIGGRGAAGFTMFYTVTSPWAMSREQKISGPCFPSYLCHYTDLYYVDRQYWAPLHYNFTPGFLVARHAGVDDQDCQGTTGRFDRMLTRLTFVASDGSETELVDAINNGRPRGIGGDCYTGQSRGTVWYSTDGSAMTFISDAPISDQTSFAITRPSGNLMMKDGTKYRIDAGRVTSICDRNGNVITFSYPGLWGEIVITDPLKRVIEVKTAQNFIGLTITFKGFQSANRTISLVTDLESTLRPDFSSLHTNASAFPEISNLQFPAQSVGTVGPYNRIILPDNRQYRIWHNNYGEVARLDLPTGGRIEYDYAGGFNASPNGVVGGLAGIHRRLVTRRVYLNTTDTTPVEETRYSRPSAVDPVTVRQVVPGSEINLSYIKHYIFGDPTFSMSYKADPTDYRKWNDGLEWKTEFYDANGTTLIKRIERNFQPRITHDWSPAPGIPIMVSFDPQLRSETTTLADVTPNLVSQTTYDYDQYNNVTDVHEYGFGSGAPGPLIRSIHASYLTINENQGNVNYAAELNIHIRNLPVQKSVYDDSGNLMSQTDFIYDYYGAYPLVDCPGIVQHDGGFHTGYGARGNLTEVIRHNPGGSPSEIHLQNQYDIAGNVVKTVDGRGHATDFDFSDRLGSPGNDARLNAGAPELAGGSSYAFPTKVTNKVTDTLTLTTYTQYDYYLGAPVTKEDENGIVSSIAYNDALDRPTQSVQARYKVGVGVPAERRQMTTVYDDANRRITTTSDLNTFNDNVLTGKSYYDGLGRMRRRATREGATWATTDTLFDALGRVSQVSNPYRAADPDTASPPSGAFAAWTKTDYDMLSREVRVTTADGAHLDTIYIGNQVTVTDQAGKKRRSEIDALRRLTKLIEDPGGLNYVTYYSYDALDNLLLVTQGSQTRSFDYDSLSRLTSAANPESGTVTYAYDANGNLIERMDARGVKTAMTYDELNRIRSKAYTGLTPEGTAAASLTPPVNYFYDVYTGMPSGAPSWPGTPSKGKQVGVTYGTGSEGTYYKYDAAGRIVTNHQRQGTSNYVTSYVYNLAGGVTREDRGNPARRRNWMYYDEAGRLMSMQTGIFNANGFEPHDLVLDISYAPFGGIQSETYGNGLIHSMAYNERHQLSEIRLGRQDNLESVFRLGYIHGAVYNVNGQDPEITLAHNNGNIARIKYFISGALQYSQTFQYDPVNRLSYAVEHNNGVYNDGARAWYQTFAYDPYGNRGVDVANTSDNVDDANRALKLADFSGANNRIMRSEYVYDSSGNLIAEPLENFTYDAEGRIVMASVAGGSTSQYVYDGNSRRVKKIVGGVATRFEYGVGGELIAERNESTGAVIKDYFYKGGELLATTKAGISGEYQYATADHLGSPRAWTDDSGALIAGGRHDYLPFGGELFAGYGMRTTDQGYAANTQQDGQRKQFGSKERDIETGLDFFISRYFSSTQGRYVSPDYFSGNPATLLNSFDRSSALPYAILSNPQTINLYSYVENNPLSLIDPDGHIGKRDKLGRYTVRVDRSNPNDAPNIHVFDGKKEIGRVALKESGPEWSGDMDSPKYAGLQRKVLEYAESKGIQPRTPNFGGGGAGARARGGRGGGASNVIVALTVIQLGLEIAEAQLDKRQLGYHFDFFGRLVIDDLNKAVNNLPRGTTLDVTIDGIRYHFVKLDQHFITTDPSCEYCTLDVDEHGNFRLKGRRTCCD
jgi:RHS repeat-associated protein